MLNIYTMVSPVLAASPEPLGQVSSSDPLLSSHPLTTPHILYPAPHHLVSHPVNSMKMHINFSAFVPQLPIVCRSLVVIVVHVEELVTIVAWR